MPTLLVRYGEIGLKSNRVRRRFEDALVSDIRRKHAVAGVQCIIESTRGRIFVDSDDWRRSCEILSKTFGVVSFSPTTKVGSSMDELVEETVRFAEPLLTERASFAVRARRSGTHPYTSQEVCERVGSAILSSYGEMVLTPYAMIEYNIFDDTYPWMDTIAWRGGLNYRPSPFVTLKYETSKATFPNNEVMEHGLFILPPNTPLDPYFAERLNLRLVERVALHPEDVDPYFDVFEWDPRVTFSRLLPEGTQSARVAGEARELPADLGGIELLPLSTAGSLNGLKFLQFASRSLGKETQPRSLIAAQAAQERFASNGNTLVWVLVGHSRQADQLSHGLTYGNEYAGRLPMESLSVLPPVDGGIEPAI